MSGQETEQAVNNGGENMENPKNTVSDGLQKDRPSESPSGGKTPPPRAEAEKTPEPPQAPASVIIRESGGKGLAVGALVLSLLALGAGGFLFVQGQNVLKNQETAFNQKIDQAAVGESENAQILKENSRRQSELAAALQQIADGQRDNKEQIEAANRAYQELLRNRADWLVDETEATLNMAAQQLLLSGNVPVAVTVLENIESRLSRFEQADLLPIKQAVSSDLAALKNQPYLDISGTALRLDRLENAVAGMPLVLESTLQPGQAEAAPQEDPNASWWQRTWNKTLHGLGNLVEVRKLNNGDAMLLAPEQAYFVRENLRLRLLERRSVPERFEQRRSNGETIFRQPVPRYSGVAERAGRTEIARYEDGIERIPESQPGRRPQLSGYRARYAKHSAARSEIRGTCRSSGFRAGRKSRFRYRPCGTGGLRAC